MKPYSGPVHAGSRAFIAVALAVVLAPIGCTTKGEGAKPPVPARQIVVKKRHPPQSDTLDRYDDQPSDFDSASFNGVVWEWLGNLTPADTLRVEQPAQYTLELRSDGWFNIRTDCGEGEGMYETRNERIVMAVVELNNGTCPADSYHDVFVQSLEAAGSFRLAGDRLYFDMRREAKTMVFWRSK